MKGPQYSLDVVRRAAVSRWTQINSHLTGVPEKFFSQTKEGPCFACHGNTRFRPYDDFSETGGCRCNHCGNWGTGFEFIAAVRKFSVGEAVNMVGEYLNCEPKAKRSKERKRKASTAVKTETSNDNVPDQDETPAKMKQENPEQKTERKQLENPERTKLRKQLAEVEAVRRQLLREGSEDWTSRIDEIRELKNAIDSLQWLAEELSVNVESLESLGVRYVSGDCYWLFPEHDSKRKTIGINRRFGNGSKKSFGKRGLYFAADWLDRPGPVLIVEGGSDTAAGIMLGLSIIGRPMAKVPKDLKPELTKLLKAVGPDRRIIVVGENDKKSDDWEKDPQKWPGRAGAIDTANFLAADLGRMVEWGLPEESVKDLRQWLIMNPGKNGADFVELLDVDDAEVEDSREPASEIDAKEDAEFYLMEKCTHRDGLTLRFYRDSFSRWRESRWVEVATADVRADVALYLGDRYLKVTTGAINNVIEFVKALTIISSNIDMPMWIDGRTGYSLAFQNGVAALEDLILGKPDCLRPSSPMWFSQVILPFAYQPEAECPLWLDVLFTNLEGDISRIELLQEFVGYCLTKSTEHHSALTLIGEGQNGKSVTLAGITAILGKQNVSSLSLDELSEKFKSYRLVGKLANVCADLSETSKVCEGTLKKLISGDALEFERKNRDPFSAIPTAKLIFSTNTLPQFYDRSNGLWRRLIIMPFNRQVTETEKVTGMDQAEWWLQKGELPGMLIWALRGLQQLKHNGAFTQSRRCTEALSQHRLECNHALSWLRQEFEPTDDGSGYSKPLMYTQYVDHCKTSGYKQLGMAAFGKEVVKAFGPLETIRSFDPFSDSGGRSRFYCGLRRIPEDSEKRDEQPY
jgi:P4 family phage/plasmid primase-like protien